MSDRDPATALNRMPRRIVAPLWFFLGGLGAGAYVFGVLLGVLLHDREGLAHARFGDLAGLVCVGIGAALLTAELTRPLAMWRLLARVKIVSPLSQGVWFLTLFLLCAFLECLSVYGIVHLPGAAIVGWVGVGLAIGLASYTGLLLVGSSRPLWSASVLPGPLFLTLALASGGALHLAAQPLLRSYESTTRVSAAVGVLAIGAMVLTLAWVLVVRARVGRDHPRLQLLLRGRLAPLYWGSRVCGALVPGVLLAPAAFGGACALPVLVGASTLAGGLGLRYTIYNADLEKR